MMYRPALMSGPMVRATLKDLKTHTRRIAKISEHHYYRDGEISRTDYHFRNRIVSNLESLATLCPYGQSGDRIWIRETTKLISKGPGDTRGIQYCADGEMGDVHFVEKPAGAPDLYSIGKVPSIHMPRWVCRIELEIIEVRVERLQDISEEDAKAEGARWHDGNGVGASGYRHDRDDGYVFDTAKQSYARLWDRINGAGAWAKNPWVWVIVFKRTKP